MQIGQKSHTVCFLLKGSSSIISKGRRRKLSDYCYSLNLTNFNLNFCNNDNENISQWMGIKRPQTLKRNMA